MLLACFLLWFAAVNGERTHSFAPKGSHVIVSIKQIEIVLHNLCHQQTRKCGCAPNAAIRTRFNSKAFVFADEKYYFYDGEEDSITNQPVTFPQVSISGSFLGLPSNLDLAFAAFDKQFFVKNEEFWIYNQLNELIAYGSTIEDWTGFPNNATAAQSLDYDKKEKNAMVEIITTEMVYFCNLTNSNLKLTCNVNSTRVFDKLEKEVGSPIHAATILRGGTRLIFGSQLVCVSIPPYNRVSMKTRSKSAH